MEDDQFRPQEEVGMRPLIGPRAIVQEQHVRPRV